MSKHLNPKVLPDFAFYTVCSDQEFTFNDLLISFVGDLNFDTTRPKLSVPEVLTVKQRILIVGAALQTLKKNVIKAMLRKVIWVRISKIIFKVDKNIL